MLSLILLLALVAASPYAAPGVHKLPLFVAADLDELGLSPHAFRIACRIARRWDPEDGCYESVPNMAEGCRMDRKTGWKAVGELLERRVVEATPRPGKTTRYDFLPAREWVREGGPTPVDPSHETGRVEPGTRPTRRDGPPDDPSHETGRVPVPRDGTRRVSQEGIPDDDDGARAREAWATGSGAGPSLDELGPQAAAYRDQVEDRLALPEPDRERWGFRVLRVTGGNVVEARRDLDARRQRAGPTALTAALVVADNEAVAQRYGSRLRYLDSVLDSLSDHARKSRLGPTEPPAPLRDRRAPGPVRRGAHGPGFDV